MRANVKGLLKGFNTTLPRELYYRNWDKIDPFVDPFGRPAAVVRIPPPLTQVRRLPVPQPTPVLKVLSIWQLAPPARRSPPPIHGSDVRLGPVFPSPVRRPQPPLRTEAEIADAVKALGSQPWPPELREALSRLPVGDSVRRRRRLTTSSGEHIRVTLPRPPSDATDGR